MPPLLLLAACAALAAGLASALQPPPRAAPRRARPSLSARRYDGGGGGGGAALPALSIRACAGAAAPGQTQAFALDAATRALALADGRCLLRRADAPGGVTAGACTGGADSNWTLRSCDVPGCTSGSNESFVASALDGEVVGVPGAVGPDVAMWTVDSPTGACHNELFAWNAADASLRSLCLNKGDAGSPPVCPDGPSILGLCLTVVEPPPPPPPPPPCFLRPRAACHVGVWDAAPHRTPSSGVVDGPLLGNGDLGAGLSASGAAATWWIGKSDMWATNTAVDSPTPTLHSDAFYTAIGAGSLAVVPADSAFLGSGATFAATQDLASASVAATLSAGGGALNLSFASAIIAADENTLLVSLRISGGSGGPLATNITVSQAQASVFGLPTSVGVLGGSAAPAPPTPLAWAAFAAKSGVTATHNSLLLMPCDTRTFVITPSTNIWAADDSTLRLRLNNGTAAPQQCPSLVGAGAAAKVSISDCGADGDGATDWRLVAAPVGQGGAPDGALQLQLQGGSGECAWAATPQYHNSGGIVAVGACSAQAGAWWSWDAQAGLLHYNESQCLVAVPPNVNVTIALAASVFLASDGSPAPLLSSSADAAASTATATVALLPDTDYLLVLAAPTNRDLGGADPLAGALGLLGRYAGAAGVEYAAARRTAHATFWTSYWAASEVNLGEGRQLLEGFYYGAQYLLGSTARAGKVPPGLWGVFNFVDANGWNGDLTLDYNAQATYYGAASSNRAELIVPYLDTVGSEWHLAMSRQRAAANWRAKGSAGNPGQVSQSMTCGYMEHAYEDPAVCPARTPGGYSGLEMTTHIGPFNGLYYFSDLSLRVVAPMSAMPFVEFADYTADDVFLRERAYPLVSEVVDFFASYVTPNAATGALDILDSCAQEICGGGPNGESNPHHDIAFLRAMLQALLRWSARLGVDGDRRAAWQQLLDGLAPLPTGEHAGATVWLEANATDANFLSNAGAFSIVYYAALHPAQIVSLSSDAATLATAWATVSQVNAVNSYRPINGLCMAWPPATRVAGAARAASVLDAFEDALRATMNANFYPDLGGGGVEQFGAIEAVNGALLQSQEGFLRFFPMWPPSENASFANLRARGAFLVSASFAGGATAAPVLVLADASSAGAAPARNCSVLDPWSSPGAPPPWRPLVVRDSGGAPVDVVADPTWTQRLPVWLFTARSGEQYTVLPAAAAPATTAAADAVAAGPSSVVGSSFPWQNTSLPVAQRVTNLVSLMTLDEAVANLYGNGAPGAPRLGLGAYRYDEECMRGAVTSGVSQRPLGTGVPTLLALAGTFDLALIARVAAIGATEVRAYYNVDRRTAGLVTTANCYAPVVNLVRDPRFGRAAEMSIGEDPTLGRIIARAWTAAMRGGAPGETARRVTSVCKHLATYSGPEDGRMAFEAALDERTWRESFLPAFRGAAEAGTSAFMCSYSALTLTDAPARSLRVPECASGLLLNQVLRGEWAWHGWVTSDANAISNIYAAHNFSTSAAAAAIAAISGGCDMELTCCKSEPIFGTLVASVNGGNLSRSVVDAALARVLAGRFAAGDLDPPASSPWAGLNESDIYSAASLVTAREAARAAVVLLANAPPARGGLPWPRGALTGLHVCVVGPLANATSDFMGGYAPVPRPGDIISPLAALSSALAGVAAGVTLVPGCAPGDGVYCAKLQPALGPVLAACDRIIAVLGTSASAPMCHAGMNLGREAEGCDRDGLVLAGMQASVLEACLSSGAPVAVAVASGGMVALGGAALAHAHLAALLAAPFGGQFAGDALAAVILGDENPAGRLTTSWYSAEAAARLPAISNYSMAGRTYRYADEADVDFVFGHGLSFSTFAYADLSVAPANPGPCDTVTVTALLTNAAGPAGAEVAQLYVSFMGASVPRPPRLALVNFEKVVLAAGGRVTLNLTITPEDNSVLREGDFVPVIEPGARALWLGASSSAARSAPGLAGAFTVSGPATPLSQCGGGGPMRAASHGAAHTWPRPELNGERAGGAARWDPAAL